MSKFLYTITKKDGEEISDWKDVSQTFVERKRFFSLLKLREYVDMLNVLATRRGKDENYGIFLKETKITYTKI